MQGASECGGRRAPLGRPLDHRTRSPVSRAAARPFLDELRALGGVTVEHAVAVVGHAIGESPQTLGAIFSTLAHEGIALRMVSMGARRTNVGIVVDEHDTAKAVNALHAALLNEPRLAKVTAKK